MRKGRIMRKEYEKRTSRTQNPTKTTSGFLIKRDPAHGMQDAWP